MSTFDLKSFMINEGLTRVSRDRKKLLKENRKPLNEYFTCTVDGVELDQRDFRQVANYVEQRYGYRPDEDTIDRFFESYEDEDVINYLDSYKDFESPEWDEEFFDLYFNPERGNGSWNEIPEK